jgi:hypothetical protein
MGLYKSRTYINGMPVDVTKACPYDHSTDITFPVRENWVSPSGLLQPWRALDNSGLPVPGGIETYLAPSGLQHTYKTPWATNTGYLGRNTTTYYGEVNWVRNFWGCNTCHKLFSYPAYVGLPSGVSAVDNCTNMPFVTDAGTQRSQ